MRKLKNIRKVILMDTKGDYNIKEVTKLYDDLVDAGLFTSEELRLITTINGYTIETITEVIYSRYGYRYGDYEELDKVTDLINQLVESELFTTQELHLLTNINGYSIATLNDAIFVRYGYSNYEQMREAQKWQD